VTARHHVVIVGGGFGGLFAAKALRRVEVEVTLIDRTTHHLFQPLLYQVATGILSEGSVAPPLRDVLRHQQNAQVMLGEVVDVDLDARLLAVETLGRRSEIGYDSLIVAAGAAPSYFGRDEFAEYAPGMKTIDDALELRGRIFGALELAEHETDAEELGRLLTFVVVGAGPTGVELVGQLIELTRHSLSSNFRRIDSSQARIILLDAASSVLGSFPESLQQRAAHDLEEMGVEIHLGTRVTSVDAEGIETNSAAPELRRVEAATKIWAAGVEASPFGRVLAEKAGSGVDRAGKVKVKPDLTLPGHPEVFVVGDLMSFDEMPGVARVAIDSGRHAAETIARRLAGDETARAFQYRDRGATATISRFRAVGRIGRFRIAGFSAWLLWLVVHLGGLTGFKNRLLVLAHWTITFLAHGRPERAITEQQVFARSALQRLRTDDEPARLGSALSADR
jgi:NADH dehydrogenase